MHRRFTLSIWFLLVLSNASNHVFGLIGTTTNIRHNPVHYQVQLHDGLSDFCGGSILSPRHILTSAQCIVEERKRLRSGPIYVIAGANNFGMAKDWARVRMVHMPAMFDYTCKMLKCLQNDIAVLELKQELHINDNPDLNNVNLPKPNTRINTYENKTAVVCGYGADMLELRPNRETGTVEVEFVRYPDTLRVAEVDVLTQNDCRKAWTGDIDVGDGHMCARMRGTAYRGVCHGDGGNGLVHDNDTIIGIVSFGNEFCFEGAAYDGQPSLYTRVSHYVDFIHDAMRGEKSYRVRSYEVDAQSTSIGVMLFSEKCMVLLQIVVTLFFYGVLD